jgi:hypothetical protein
MRAGTGGRGYHASTLFGAGEVKLIIRALRWKEIAFK